MPEEESKNKKLEDTC